MTNIFTDNSKNDEGKDINKNKHVEIEIKNLDFNWPKNLGVNDKVFLIEFLEELKKFDIYQYFHKDVDSKGMINKFIKFFRISGL